jgi:hypothetical protein
MSATPPDPGIPVSLPSSVARYAYDDTNHALKSSSGDLAYLVLAEEPSGNHGVRWTIDPPRTPCPVVLLDQATYDMLVAGTVTDGLLVSGGVTYHLRAVRHMDGSVWMTPSTS